MQHIFNTTIKYIPQLLFSVALIIVQLLFINTNIIGIYLFGSLYLNSDYFKIFTAVCVVTLLFDSLKMLNLGSWAVSYYVIALIVEVVLRTLKIRTEVQRNTIRGNSILFLIIVFSAIGQNYVLQQLGRQALVNGNEFSIVIIAVLYLLLNRTISSRKSYDYLRI